MSEWRRLMRFVHRDDWERPAPPPRVYGIWDNVHNEWVARRLT